MQTYEINELNFYANHFNQRLGQFITNIVPEGADLFYITDGLLMSNAREYFQKHGNTEHDLNEAWGV